MKTLYYVVEKELENVGGVEETSGYKDIRLYDIVDNVPKLIIGINVENEENSLEVLKEFTSKLTIEKSTNIITIKLADDDDEEENEKETYEFVLL